MLHLLIPAISLNITVNFTMFHAEKENTHDNTMNLTRLDEYLIILTITKVLILMTFLLSQRTLESQNTRKT